MSSSRDPTRLRLGLNPLTTQLGHFNAQHGAPLSAISMASSHMTPHMTPTQTPASAIQPYNPQEWVASPVVERQSQYVGEPQGSPLPPPPYSPPRSQQQRPLSSVFDQPVSTPSPPVPRIPSGLHLPSPEPPANVSFPPPPGSSGRGASRDRRFGLPSLTRRPRDHEQQPSTPEPHQSRSLIGNRDSPAGPAGPSSFHMPEPVRPTVITHSGYTGPPAARRAVSAGAIETPTSARSRSGSQTRWESAMGVPPPPPGPPPSQSRSQSVQPIDRTTVPVISPPTRRPPTTLSGSVLGPVPPTPADWVDDSNDNNTRKATAQAQAQGLTIDTEIAQNSDQVPDPLLSSSSNSGLNRARAVRHDKTIVQRRAESKTRHSARSSIDERTQPHIMTNIVVPGSASSSSARLTPQTGESSRQAEAQELTPRTASSGKLPRIDTGISPFHPLSSKSIGSSTIAPKALPTPPPRSASKARESSRPPTATTSVSKNLIITQSAEQFAAGTIERFQMFASQEAAATTDADRVRLFADFIVNESRVRRERYSTAIGAMGSEIFDLTRDLFRPMIAERRGSVTSPEEYTPDSSQPTPSHRGSIGSVLLDNGGPSSAPGSGRLPPSPSTGNQNNANYNSNFMPSLSPILSLSVSDAYDDRDSRGRPSSRWWEADSQGDGSRRFERSKRESKYMGVPKDQWADAESTTNSHVQSSDHGSSSEYPPEKTGWHDQPEDAAWTPQPSKFFNAAPGSTPSPAPRVSQDQLDVSRLVTMPPPYPRHHPAVNNNHPELTETRVSVRTLTDLSEMDVVKEKFTIGSSKRRDEMARAATERQQALRANLQREIGGGNLNYADAAAIEADSQTQENNAKKDLEKSEYELYQNEVVMPLNDLLMARIARATELYENLARGLFDRGENDVDMPQEEGDDRPELLEKLTLLKWIFEARESLHRAIYDLLSERNDRFRDVVTTPYRLANNTEKLKNAEAFFGEDAAKREYAFANEVLDRTREFRGVVDEAVQRGVALQLSAFWDIAPPLSRLLESVPLDLRGFNIQIPFSEFDENPSYRDHPMQYLLSLLLHTEKSTYQFIEAHTNLLCLLHEVKEAVVHAKARVLATQTAEADGTPINLQQREERSQHLRHTEGQRLTDDLKEKVRVVQDQWKNGLAESIKDVKERISEWLLQTGGWDDAILQDA